MTNPVPSPSDASRDDAIIDVRERINWHQSPIDPALMKALIQRSDFQGFKQVGLHLGLIALTSTAVIYSWYHLAWWWTLLAVFLHGSFYGFFGGGVAGHELSHRTVFKTRKLNDVFATLSSIMGWGNHHFFRISHIKHHQYTVHDDLDMEVVLPSKLTRMSWVYALSINPRGVFNHLKATVRVALGRVRGEWEERLFAANPDAFKARARQARLNLLVHGVAAAIFVWQDFWVGFLVFTFAPFYFGWLQLLMGFPQHAGLSPNTPDFRLCCRTFECNPFFQFLYWQMNYHVEHHMYAAVPFYNLRRLRRAIEGDLPEAKQSLWATWREILAILKRQKAEPDYCYVPTLPTDDAAADAGPGGAVGEPLPVS